MPANSSRREGGSQGGDCAGTEPGRSVKGKAGPCRDRGQGEPGPGRGGAGRGTRRRRAPRQPVAAASPPHYRSRLAAAHSQPRCCCTQAATLLKPARSLIAAARSHTHRGIPHRGRPAAPPHCRHPLTDVSSPPAPTVSGSAATGMHLRTCDACCMQLQTCVKSDALCG